MKVSVVVLFALAIAASATASEPTLGAGAVTLTLGMSQESLLRALPVGAQLKWTRDTLPQPVAATPTPTGTQYEGRTTVNGKPVTIRYSDDYGAHGSLVAASGEHLAFVVFEDGKLTAATRHLLIGTPEAPVSAGAAATTIARVLAEWNSRGERPVVETTHVEGTIDEILFRSGQRRLVVLSSTNGHVSIAETIGREERPVVTYSH